MKNIRNENLQILRFIAAALVLVTHISFYIHERININVNVWHGGEGGVPIFFIISGFVMYFTGEKISRNAEGAKYFIRRRIVRIFPLYWLITTFKLAVALILPAAILHNHPSFLKVLGSYVLFPMFNSAGEVRPIHGVAWTLLHEMLFYYVFTISLLLRQSPFVFSSIIMLALWTVGCFITAKSALTHVLFSDLNLMFVAGMLLAAVYKQGFRLNKSLASLFLLIGIVLLLSLEFGEIRRTYIGDFNIEAVLIVAALLSIRISVFPKLKEAFVKLGDSSYSLYLIHPILAPAVCLALFACNIQSIYLLLPITFAICVLCGHFLNRFVENPMNHKFELFLERLFNPSMQKQVLK